MTTGRLISQDEKLRRATSRVLTEVVINQSATETDIASGIYKPLSKIANLINIERLLQQETVVTTIPTIKPSIVIKR
ncbi:MAG: hypothetical protein U0V02_07105 [Anaerolineales bacterium]